MEEIKDKDLPINSDGAENTDSADSSAKAELDEKEKQRLEDEKRYEALNAYIAKMKDVNDYSESYEVTLNSFEGPIHLLLHLVKAAKIRIQDIFVSQITDQYLRYLEQLPEIDLEKASDFIEVAAMLIEIKSKALLPRLDEENDDNSAQRELIQKLDEYRLFKEVAEKMKEKETVGLYFKEPDRTVGNTRVVLKDMTKEGLMGALQKLFLKFEQRALTPPARRITLDRFTVSDRIAFIRDAITEREEITFYGLFDSDFTKGEIITTFQALLELLKMQQIKVSQEDVFAEIHIKRNPLFKPDDDSDELLSGIDLDPELPVS